MEQSDGAPPSPPVLPSENPPSEPPSSILLQGRVVLTPAEQQARQDKLIADLQLQLANLNESDTLWHTLKAWSAYATIVKAVYDRLRAIEEGATGKTAIKQALDALLVPFIEPYLAGPFGPEASQLITIAENVAVGEGPGTLAELTLVGFQKLIDQAIDAQIEKNQEQEQEIQNQIDVLSRGAPPTTVVANIVNRVLRARSARGSTSADRSVALIRVAHHSAFATCPTGVAESAPRQSRRLRSSPLRRTTPAPSSSSSPSPSGDYEHLAMPATSSPRRFRA